MIASANLDFSFSGLKTAVATLARAQPLDDAGRADLAAAFQEAIVDVLVAKCARRSRRPALRRLVVAGGVGANRRLRARARRRRGKRRIRDASIPELDLCTDNGAMIALAGAMRLAAGDSDGRGLAFTVRPRWDLADLAPVG